jgi:glycolate oxidase iron-sulfur subunit
MSPSNKSLNFLQNCGKCGLCLAACPVYRELKEEQASPRARLQLIKGFEKNNLESTPLLKELISKCLMCGSCATACPSGINHYEKFMEMRQKMAKRLGEPPAIRSLIYLLSKESRILRGAGMAKIAQKMALKLTPAKLADKYCLGNIPLKRLPRLNLLPFRRTRPLTIPARGKKRGRLIYFTGCATNYIYENTGSSVVGVLTHLGYEVIIPENQTCCGIPLMFHGAEDQAINNMVTNILALDPDESDGIIVDCTTCGAALKDEYPALIRKLIARDPQLSSRTSWEKLAVKADKIAKKTREVLSFVGEHKEKLVFDSTNLGKVAYHAPCHSRNSFNSQTLVQDLLKGLPFINYTPSPDEAQCCGGGGTFFYEHPKIAKKIMSKKTDQIKGAGIKYWLTDCPVCRINLAGNIPKTEEPRNIQVLHPITLVHRALKKIKKNPDGLGQRLVSDFDMPSYVALRVIDILNRFKVTLVSEFSREETLNLGFEYTDNLDLYLKNLIGKGYIIPFAENILPQGDKNG